MAAHRHDSDKPRLPPLASKPSPSRQTPLTIESIDHLRKFVSHVLEEETGFRDADKDAWVSSIESALNDLARAVESGAWLSGIRRARAVLAPKRKEQQPEASTAAVRTEMGVREQDRIAKDKDKETEARNKATKSRVPVSADTTKPVNAKETTEPADAEVKTEPSSHARKHPSDTANRNLCALQQLRNLANALRPPSSDGSNKRAQHLLLSVALPDAHTPRHPSFMSPPGDATPQRCTFTPSVYSLPAPDLFGEDPDDNCQAVVNSTLYGFEDWDVNLLETHNNIELIGGTFSLSKVPSADEHASLVRVLRVSTYVLLSLLLEQHFLTSSSVELRYPKPITHTTSLPSPASTISHRNSSPEIRVEGKLRKRDLLRQTIWSLIQNRFNRSATLNTSDSRDVSLDLTNTEPDTYKTPRASLDISSPSAPRQRRFSIFGESRPPPPSPSTAASEPSPDRSFQSALRRIEEGKGLLSASPGLIIQSPPLLVRLAESEKANPSRRLTGEERTGLTSILGWEGKTAAGRGNMTGIAGFLRQQQLSLLYAEHVRVPDRTSQPSADGTVNKPSEGGESKPLTHVHCGNRVQWLTYVYYASGNHDRSLGDMITSICMRADEPCTQPGCKSLQRQHERRWIHGGIRVVAQIEPRDPAISPGVHSEDVEMWQSCKICQKATIRCKMSDGTYLFSFAKFLELLLYSPAISILSHTLCTHTSSSTPKTSSFPASRFNLMRHFSYKSYRVSFTLSSVDDIFDLRVPRLQFMKGGWIEKSPPGTASSIVAMDESDKRELRQEIKQWWQAVAEHLDKVEAEFSDKEAPERKSLPRLPSTDDAWEDVSEEGLTPKGLVPVSLPPTPTHSAEPSSSSLATIRPSQSGSEPSSVTTGSSDDLNDSDSPLRLLTNMRYAFQRAEQALYAQLRDTPYAALNNVRREFHSAAQGAIRRLAAWEAKHVPKDRRARLAADREAIQEPKWWHSGYHAVPGGNVIVQEEDWGSIIAFTLSSIDYQRELANMMHARASQGQAAPHPSPPVQLASTRQNTMSTLGRSSASGSTSSFKFFGSSHKPDPDREDSVWHEPEPYSAVVSRKEHPRDPTALLSLREVLRHKVPVEGSQGSQPSAIASVSRMVNNAAPPSAWAKPAVEVSMAAVDGHVTGMPEAVVTAGRILHELDGASILSKGSIDSTTSAFVETNVHRGKTSSLFPRGATESDGGYGSTTSLHAPLRAAAERTYAGVPAGSRSRSSTVSTTHDASGQEAATATAAAGAAANDGSILSWTNSLTTAMRYMIKGDIPSRPTTPAANHHHGLLYADPLTIDERPHIKYDWTIGRRLKFSCTVYYARQFDALRRRCGVSEDGFARSMAKCEPWKAQGGKSRSNFWKTSDERFIIKTLVNAWNVADLQVLIELAPSYFLHMESTASRASILAKLLGFYTVEVRNLETGTVLAKADLLVMENLFNGQKPTKTFDLKGIQGRKVKAKSNTSASKTLFDSEWIEGQQRALTLVNPVSKTIFQEAVKADCDFLTRCNIMDYSLLLGVDEEGKQIHCGLVDTVGSYTFAKTLEYKAKGLSKEGKDITVVPPHEYQERLVSALDSYFMACPDKWTKPVDETKLIHDPAHLPSVL